MSRFFNHKEIELLAPTGTFEIFKKLIHSGADALYFGGKILNMRMHRKDYNFTNEEIKETIHIAHSLNKKIYITVNNLFSHQDLKDAKEYLLFLEKVQPDALIIQDFSILELIKELNLNLNLHSSVMMNIHNLETIKILRNLGITRIVASRDMDLKTIKSFHGQTDMEFEYFTHGDMCITHGAQCLYSSILFGKSSNRGLCMKPCRWNFIVKKDGLIYPTKYPMAVKDMYMYEHLPEMIDAGIVSFKIEGRMRDANYLFDLVHYYSDAIDRYIDDPICFDRKKDAQNIYESRKRDLSTGYAFGKPGLKNINQRFEGTGKVFSNPIEEWEITKERVNKIKKILQKNPRFIEKPILTVKVNSYEQAKVALEEEVDAIYLSGEAFEPHHPFYKKEIFDLTSNKKNTKIYLAFPRMMDERDFSEYTHLLDNNHFNLDGLIVTNLGAIQSFKKYKIPLIGDYCLNIYNHKAATFYKNQGLSVATLSVETPLLDAKEIIIHRPLSIEMIVHGSPVVMYLEHDLYENTKVFNPIGHEDNRYIDNHILVLVDDKGYEHPVYRDHKGKNHITLYKDLCYLPILKELHEIGVSRFRIEGAHYPIETLRRILKIYKKAVMNLDLCNELFDSFIPRQAGLTLGSFEFD